MIPSTKRKNKHIDYGFVGDVITEKINTKAFEHFSKSGVTPVIAPITCTEKGQLLNTNADSMASAIAIALSKKYQVKLIYCFEKDGVLNEKEKVIASINKNDYKHLKEKKIIKDGMIPKLDNAFDAINNGVKSVYIGHAFKLKQLTEGKHGTVITNQ
jgi:acetylglutamate kinase